MKKKIALLLAAAMTFTSVISLNAAATADTSFRVSGYGENSIIVDSGYGGAFTKTNKDLSTSEKVGNNGIGTDLYYDFDATSTLGNLVTLDLFLTEADWAYYYGGPNFLTNEAGTMYRPTSFVTSTATDAGAPGYFMNANAWDALSNSLTPFAPTPWTAPSPDFDTDYDSQYLYYKPTVANSLPYVIKFSEKSQHAQVTFVANYDKDSYLRIPMIIKAASDKPMSVSLDGKTIPISVAGSGTTTYVAGVSEGRVTTSLNRITVRENSASSFKAGGNFTVSAPDGYKFIITNNASDGNNTYVTLETDPVAFMTDEAGEILNNIHGSIISEESALFDTLYASNAPTSNFAAYSDDMTEITFYFSKNFKSTRAPGSIHFNKLGLELEDEDDEPAYGTVLQISVENGSTSAGVTNEKKDIAKFLTWNVKYGVESVKDIWAGYKNRELKKVTVAEEVIESLWSERGITFTLVDENGDVLDDVKFSKAVFKLKNIDAMKGVDLLRDTTYTINNTEAEYTSFKGYEFSKDGHKFTISGVQPQRDGTLDKKVSGEFTFWVSADVNYSGKVFLSLLNNKLEANEVQSSGIIHVANVLRKITLDAKSTSLEIGYQRYDVEDITVTELQAGALEEDKILELAIGEFGVTRTSDLAFVPITKNQISITGDLKLDLLTKATLASTLMFNIERDSKTAAAITLSDLQVKINRTVPYGTYELFAEGSAIRDNKQVDNVGRRDCFDTNGIVFSKYVDVNTEGVNTAFTKEVRIYQNSNQVMVGGVAGEMDVPTINVDGRLYIPLRFVSENLGARPEDIVWDDATGNAQIRLNGEKATWTKDSEFYVAGGVRMSMEEDGVLARAFISDDSRMYIPFRFLGYAFNIPVSYDEATGAAIYNEVVAQ